MTPGTPSRRQVNKQCHTELLAADEAVAKLLKELRDLTMLPSPAAEGLDL